jgi:carboxyl-terminal processing protease
VARRLLPVIIASACAAPSAPRVVSPAPAAAPAVVPAAQPAGPYHDPDHARGELPNAASRKGELGVLRASLDAMYAHRAEKLARYHLDEDALFADAERALLAATTWAQYDAAIYDALARFHDAHLTYHPPATAAPKRGYTSYALGISTVRAGMHLLIAQVTADAFTKAGVSPGDEVVAIDGRPVTDVLAEAGQARAISRPESAMTTFARTWTTILYPKDSPPRERSIRVATQTGSIAVKVTPQKLERVHREPASVAMNGDVAVVTIESLEGGEKRAAQIDNVLETARAAKAIVIDLRGNRGGIDLVGHRLLADLAEGTASLGTYRVKVAPETIARRPMWKSLAGTGDAQGFSPPQPITIKALDHGFKGKVAVIVDAACASTCEVMTAALRADLHAIIVGDTTGGSSGGPVSIELPSSHADVGIPTWVLTSAEGQPIEDVGVVPDVAVDATPEALRAGVDLPLKTAIDKVRP